MGIHVLLRGYLWKTYVACLRKKVSFPCHLMYVRTYVYEDCEWIEQLFPKVLDGEWM